MMNEQESAASAASAASSTMWSNTAIVVEYSDIREEYIDQYSDMHKDAYGFRPRFDYSDWSLADFEIEFEHLSRVINQRIAEDNSAYDAAATRFESRVENTIALGAGTRENAIRWMMQADNANGDIEYFCYLNGLRNGYFNR